jgi:hypothetical protein
VMLEERSKITKLQKKEPLKNNVKGVEENE